MLSLSPGSSFFRLLPSATMKELPHATCDTYLFFRAKTGNGVTLGSLSPMPSSPAIFEPQVHKRPLVSTAEPRVEAPKHTSTTGFDIETTFYGVL